MPAKPIRTRSERGQALAEIERLMGAKRGSRQADLAQLAGSRSSASAILNRKRPMSLAVIRKLAKGWDIPTDILVQLYRIRIRRSSRAA
jgi:antitoxin component HigA of HigAB toxin-antitoxin module